MYDFLIYFFLPCNLEHGDLFNLAILAGSFRKAVISNAREERKTFGKF